ncbi:MAG TPA: hypothetical protein VHE10_00740 [Candidatus Paceibacterota bacterium]|nr:hypothetical protein [Candidatus Paceibacterota bacterium]
MSVKKNTSGTGSVLSGYVDVDDRKQPEHAEHDWRFLGRGMDADDAHELQESERRGIELIEVIPERGGKRLRHTGFVFEGQLPVLQADLRNGLDACDCDCAAKGKVCIRCCTHQDLLGVPAAVTELIEVTNRRTKIVGGRKLAEVFDLVMPYGVASMLGLARAE